jgi:hypothetical protein
MVCHCCTSFFPFDQEEGGMRCQDVKDPRDFSTSDAHPQLWETGASTQDGLG